MKTLLTTRKRSISDGHPLINDKYAEVAVYFFLSNRSKIVIVNYCNGEKDILQC